MAQWLIILTIGLPWIGAVVIWLTRDRDARLQNNLASGFSVAAGVAALVLLFFPSQKPAITISMGSIFGELTFVPDGLAVFLAAIATVIGSLAVIFSRDYMHGEAQLGRYYSMVLLFIGAMAGLVLSGSLLFLFFFWEITALCSYALISFYNDDPKAVAGGIKALIITQLGGVGLLAGALTVRAATGSYDINQFLAQPNALSAGGLALLAFGFLAAAAAKSAQVPFQTWLPDAMEAPTPVSALIHAATMVNAGVYLLARFYPAFEAVPGWQISVIVVGAATALLAACMALVANDLKRLLAYSTVSQLGYMVYAIGAGGILASQFHLLSHAIFKALLFLAAGAVIHAVGTRDMRQMGGLGAKMPIVRNVFIIGALALAGLPILNGFWSKEMILEAGLQGGPIWAFAIMVLGAGLTAMYTLRGVWMVFFGETRSELHAHDATPAMRVSLVILAAGTLVSWLVAGPFAHMLHASLPFHDIHELSTAEILIEIVTAPATWGALAVIAAGLLIWQMRKFFAGLVRNLEWLNQALQAGLGFEWINRQITSLFQGSGRILSFTQTGNLNWNIVGIVTGLGIILAILYWAG